jgi:predicted enzyme related to lactoylglutathione lyase
MVRRSCPSPKHFNDRETRTKNPVITFEIPVSNLDRAISFYEKVFGYEFERVSIDGNEMAWFPMDESASGISGALAKGECYVPSIKYCSLLYFESKDNESNKFMSRRSRIGTYEWCEQNSGRPTSYYENLYLLFCHNWCKIIS